MPFYTSEEYYKLQRILRENDYPEFYLSDLGKITDVVKDSYDVLYNNDYFEAMMVKAKIEAREDDMQRNADTDIVLTYCPCKKGRLFE